MKQVDRYLTGLLLLLIGVLIGTLITLWSESDGPATPTQVRVTEVKREGGSVPDTVLREMGPRFQINRIAEEVTPSVVYIEAAVSYDRSSMPDDQYHDFEEEEDLWDRFFPDQETRTVGSGVVLTEEGYILTNNHVIAGADKKDITVMLADRREYNAKIVGRDPSTDLAVLKIEAEDLSPITVGDSNNLEVGEWVIAIGNPFRLRMTVTAGIVSALSRDVQIINDELRVESFIQTDAAINKGNSGGALVDMQGRLVGISTAIASQSGGYQGYGFAVPINLAVKVARDIIEYGEVRRALLGVQIQTVDHQRMQELKLPELTGVEIVSVLEDGAASRQGIEQGDVILSVDGRKVDKANKLQELVAVKRPGDSVDLVLWREGDRINKTIELLGVESTPEWLTSDGEEQEADTLQNDP